LSRSERYPFRRVGNQGASEGLEGDISDAIASLGYLYLGSAASGCRSAADANDDGHLDITDPVILLLDLFGTEPDNLLPPPGTFDCGFGLRGDPLGCDRYPACP
jgi:hypothetical protein